jgi:hypothetical protein
MKTLAQEELESIEYQKRTWKSKVFREMEIWEEIAMQLNSTEGEEHKHWSLVMDLYHEKYRK